MTPEAAYRRENEIREKYESQDGLRVRYSGSPPPSPEDDARVIYDELCTVGKFWKDGHGHGYFSRYYDGEDYRVGSNPKWRFSRFVCGLFNLSARAPRTRDALDRLTEQMQVYAPWGLLVVGDDAEITAALSTITVAPVVRKPLKIACKKKKYFGGGSGKRVSASHRRKVRR